MDRLIADKRDLERLVAYLHAQPFPYTVKFTEGRLRSVEQNRLMWLWANESAMQRSDSTAREVQSEWKLVFGVPILVAENEEFADAWALVEAKFTYEEQLDFMDAMPVTSIMTAKQLSRFLDQVYLSEGKAGRKLTEPEERVSA